MQPKSPHNGPSQRQLRVGEQLRHLIAETLQRGHFHSEALLDAGKVTVTEVRVSPDLKQATAYVLALGGENMDAILPALNEAAVVFQKDFSRKLQLKFTPKLRFKIDDSFDNATRLDSILSNLTYSDQDQD
jgi:ribosome-binding factor A